MFKRTSETTNVMAQMQGFEIEELARGAAIASPRDGASVEWLISRQLIDYPAAVGFMERRVTEIHLGRQTEAVWLLEHPPLYTAGTSANPDELIDRERFPVYRTGRGGRFTYHGPGQRVVYPMLDLRRRGKDIRAFVHALEGWIIGALAELGVKAERRAGRIGIWVDLGRGKEAKIAAVGVRVRKWITYHGIAINVHPNLAHFEGIVPCGISEHGVTSLQSLGISAGMSALDDALRHTFDSVLA